MATYYNGNNNNNNNSEIQGEASDGLQTLILMNPTAPYHSHHLGSFSDTGQQPHPQNNNNNLVFLNSVAASLTPRALSHAPIPHQHQHQHHHLVGIPLDPHHPSHHEIHTNFIPRVHYNIYQTDPSTAAREPTRAQQGGLSLSLTSPRSEVGGKVNAGVLGSRYLRAAQELLEEVVSMGKEVVRGGYKEGGEGGSGGCGGGERRGEGVGREISTAERQEIQMRKAKLVGMLDEVEQRYRQYHHQIQIVISWFEQATGIGSAKTYTALALQTISKQFRCLKDAISTQIQTSSKSLGEENSFGGGKGEGSRLKYVDHQMRQQRALQQLGMIQPNAWRPQRGLPERSVSVLRAWLFEHFLHPYPKDSDKIMLAKQTGLTRSQVSNWFINARVRLWKPMVEEMYMEEVKEQERKESEENTTNNENNHKNSPSKINNHLEENCATENENINFKSILSQNSPPVISPSPSPTGIQIRKPPGYSLIGSPDMESIVHASPKKQRNTEFSHSQNNYLSNEQMSMKYGDEKSFTLMGGPANFIGGFGGYPIDQFPTTYSGNGVALTLGLPHCENLSLPHGHQNFLQNQNIQMGRRLEVGEPDEFATINTSNPSHSSVSYESINIQNRKRFAAQLLPDFVT